MAIHRKNENEFATNVVNPKPRNANSAFVGTELTKKVCAQLQLVEDDECSPAAAKAFMAAFNKIPRMTGTYDDLPPEVVEVLSIPFQMVKACMPMLPDVVLTRVFTGDIIMGYSQGLGITEEDVEFPGLLQMGFITHLVKKKVLKEMEAGGYMDGTLLAAKRLLKAVVFETYSLLLKGEARRNVMTMTTSWIDDIMDRYDAFKTVTVVDTPEPTAAPIPAPPPPMEPTEEEIKCSELSAMLGDELDNFFKTTSDQRQRSLEALDSIYRNFTLARNTHGEERLQAMTEANLKIYEVRADAINQWSREGFYDNVEENLIANDVVAGGFTADGLRCMVTPLLALRNAGLIASTFTFSNMLRVVGAMEKIFDVEGVDFTRGSVSTNVVRLQSLYSRLFRPMAAFQGDHIRVSTNAQIQELAHGVADYLVDIFWIHASIRKGNNPDVSIFGRMKDALARHINVMFTNTLARQANQQTPKVDGVQQVVNQQPVNNESELTMTNATNTTTTTTTEGNQPTVIVEDKYAGLSPELRAAFEKVDAINADHEGRAKAQAEWNAKVDERVAKIEKEQADWNKQFEDRFSAFEKKTNERLDKLEAGKTTEKVYVWSGSSSGSDSASRRHDDWFEEDSLSGKILTGAVVGGATYGAIRGTMWLFDRFTSGNES